jgi:hypothetical protein
MERSTYLKSDEKITIQSTLRKLDAQGTDLLQESWFPIKWMNAISNLFRSKVKKEELYKQIYSDGDVWDEAISESEKHKQAVRETKINTTTDAMVAAYKKYYPNERPPYRLEINLIKKALTKDPGFLSSLNPSDGYSADAPTEEELALQALILLNPGDALSSE